MDRIKTVTESRDACCDLVELDALLATIWIEVVLVWWQRVGGPRNGKDRVRRLASLSHKHCGCCCEEMLRVEQRCG